MTTRMDRLQKILAAAGVASRRKAEELIRAGRVAVNGKVVTELGSKANPATDTIALDGKPLQPPQRFVYLLLNKPKGYITTASDPEGRPTVLDLLGDLRERVYPVGRLDYASEGLLLLTNDGTLAQQLTKAASHVPKTYQVKISGKPREQALQRLRNGVTIPLDDGRRVKLSPTKIRLLEDAPNPWYEITLIEGRNRQIRRMFEEVGHHVEKIKRVQLGPLTLDVAPGKYRQLNEREVQALKDSSARK
jgi:23S rRNA pseudouridine2605 synthase